MENKILEANECAKAIRETLKQKGKEVSDYDLGYLMGKVDAKERGNDEAKKRSDQ